VCHLYDYIFGRVFKSLYGGGENMRKVCFLLTIAVTVSLLGCAAEEEPLDTPQTVNAADIWRRISQDKPYTEYDFWPDVEGIMEGNAPHGAFIQTFVNEKALRPTETGYPYGSLIIKENYMPDTTLAKLTIMYKVKGYDPQSGDWFWAVYRPDGTVEGEGKIQSCIGCHSVRADQDHVFLHSYR
jgi:hypothetical protein